MKHIIKPILFLAICAFLFLAVVNPVLSVQAENTELRTVTDGLLALPEETVDVLLFSPSNIMTFWQGPLAFHEAGIASYGLTAGYNYLLGYPYEAMQALKTQSPKLIVIDLVLLYEQLNLVYTFNVSESLRDRALFQRFMERASEEFDRSGTEYDKMELLLPFLRFHHNWKDIRETVSLAVKPHMEDIFMGFWCLFPQEFSEAAPDWDQLLSEPQAPLEDWQERILRDLLDYCDTLNCEVLFIRCPQTRYIQYWHREWQSAVEYVEERGYPVLDTIPYYDEMGLDWPEDYYNGDHTNYYGSIKFTRWLADYLRVHYDLPDRRGQDGWETWEAEYQRLQEYVRQHEDAKG